MFAHVAMLSVNQTHRPAIACSRCAGLHPTGQNCRLADGLPRGLAGANGCPTDHLLLAVFPSGLKLLWHVLGKSGISMPQLRMTVAFKVVKPCRHTKRVELQLKMAQMLDPLL